MKKISLFDGTAITLEEILDARSARAERQRAFLAEGGMSLISFALNMPGPVKQSVTARRVFEEGIREIRKAIESLSGAVPGAEKAASEISGKTAEKFTAETAKKTAVETSEKKAAEKAAAETSGKMATEKGRVILREDISHEMTGSQAFFLLNLPADRIKKKMTEIEEYHPLGRLFDIDVIGPDGVPLSRTQFGLPARTCMVCGENAKICARSGAHSAEIIAYTLNDLVHSYFRDKEADRVAICATRALLYEVSTTPKPGLVDRANQGSHSDMDYFTFVDSSATLCHWFRDMFCVGWDHADDSPESLFRRLQFIGKMADRAMFRATGGANTHQGLIYAVTIIAAAIGKMMRTGSAEEIPEKHLIEECRKIGRCSLREKFGCSGISPEAGEEKDKNKAPEPLRAAESESSLINSGREAAKGNETPAYGARGEAAEGFPHALNIGLPAIRKWLAQGCSLNDASCAALLSIIAETEDTNMIRRGGNEEAQRRREEAREILRNMTAETIVPDISKLDSDYIRHHLSPGGSADILAISLLFCFCEEEGILTGDHA